MPFVKKECCACGDSPFLIALLHPLRSVWEPRCEIVQMILHIGANVKLQDAPNAPQCRTTLIQEGDGPHTVSVHDRFVEGRVLNSATQDRQVMLVVRECAIPIKNTPRHPTLFGMKAYYFHRQLVRRTPPMADEHVGICCKVATSSTKEQRKSFVNGFTNSSRIT